MRRLYPLFTLIAYSVVGSLLLMGTPLPLFAAPAAQSADPVIIAAGDVSNCSNWQDEETARLVDAIDGTVLGLGDLAYEVGSLQEYNECYAPTWGRFKDRTRPVPGNHEYGKGNADGYWAYWGDQATPLEPGCTSGCKGYYSFDLGAWHIVALNSEIPNQTGSEQEQWLRADLAAYPNVCTLAYWHRATFTSGRRASGEVIDLFRALYDYGVDLLLVGHEHDYERFAPQSPSGQYEPERGVRQIVVGTGGAQLRDFTFIQPNSEMRSSETFGVLKVTLHPTGYDWEFVPIISQNFRDSGSGNCVTVDTLPAPPVVVPAATDSATGAAAPVAAAPLAAAPVVAAPAPAAVVLPAGLDYVVQAGDSLSAIAARYGLNWTEIATANGLADGSLIQVGQVLRLPGVQATASTVATTTTTTASTGALVQQVPVAAPTPAGATTTALPTSSAASATGSAGRYIVRSGDTLFAIALRNNTTWPELAAANGLSENDLIQVGQELILPGQAGATTVQTTTATVSLLPTPTPTPATQVAPTATPQPVTVAPRTHTVAAGDTLVSIAARYGLGWRQLLALNGMTESSVIRVGQQIRLE